MKNLLCVAATLFAFSFTANADVLENSKLKTAISASGHISDLTEMLNNEGNVEWNVDVTSIQCVAVEDIEIGEELVGSCVFTASTSGDAVDAVWAVNVGYNFNEERHALLSVTALSMSID